MGMALAQKECETDRDCSQEQYCYQLHSSSLGHCADYINCARYHREDAEGYARDPSQCGTCIKGYTAEILATGERAVVCKSNDGSQDDEGVVLKGGALEIWIFVIVASFVMASFAVYFFIRKRRTSATADAEGDAVCQELVVMKSQPSAPPQEYRPFMDDCSSFTLEESIKLNNNKSLKDRNKLVNAVPFHHPDWIRHPPDYEEQQASNDTPDSADPRSLSPAALQTDEDTTPSSWTPEESTAQIAERPFSQFVTEQRDNAVNAALIQRGCPETFNVTSPNTESPNESVPESTAQGHSSERTRPQRNVLINQTLTINLINED